MDDLDGLILHVLNREADATEIGDFLEWLKVPEHEEYFNRVREVWNLTSGPRCRPEQVEKEFKYFRRFMRTGKRKHEAVNFREIRRIVSWVAACLLPFALGIYLLLPMDTEETLPPSICIAAQPGQAKALLTIASGKRITLDANAEREMFIGQNTRIHNLGSSIVYADTCVSTKTLQYNHLSVPRGGEFRVTLSDGTVVYMNSASDLKYPVIFGKDKRVIRLSGEAYFEVKKDITRPFYVETDAAIIKVYGTSFNINTRHHNCTRTVLVSGSVGIRGEKPGSPEYKLNPLQMADFSDDGSLATICDVDVRPHIAWKDGLFVFEEQSLEDILNTLSLWYDVEVFYTNPEVKNYHFTGYMERYKQIDKILNAIGKMVGVKFSVQGKTLVVSK